LGGENREKLGRAKVTFYLFFGLKIKGGIKDASLFFIPYDAMV